MQFGFPFLDVLTIPTDAGPGDPRVIITGDPPKILVQSPSGSYVQLIPGLNDAEINLNPPDFTGHTLVVGRIIADVDEARELPFIVIGSPTIDGLQDLRLFIQGEAGDGTRPTLNIDSGATAGNPPFADVQIDGKGIGKGIIAQFTSSSSFAAVSATTTTDIVLNNVPVIANDRYAIHLHTPWEVLGTPGRWITNLLLNGAAFDRFDDTGALSADTDGVTDSTVYWTPSTTQATDDLAVQLQEVSGASNMSLPAAGTATRKLTLIHLGRT